MSPAAPSENQPKSSEIPAQNSTIPITRDQADQMLSEMKSIKQNIFVLLLILGFFAVRSLLFHD